MTKTKLIVNLTRGSCVCVGELADRPLTRMRGLIGRRGLPAGEGLLLKHEFAIHTAFMRFPIDVLFLDRELRVVDIAENLRPWRVASKRRARAVLELTAGECARRGVKIGDRLELRNRNPVDDGRASVPKRANSSTRANGSMETAGTAASGPGRTPVLRRREGEVARLQPLRVLVLSRDRHFRTVMSLLLARRNCSVTTAANAARVTELVAGERADVVVVDTSQLPVASTVATVQGLAQPVGLVLVSDEASDQAPDLPVLAKWGPFDDLLEAIERADERRATRRGTGGR